MLLPAIGFAAERIEGVPFDERARIIANEEGRVVESVSRTRIPHEYVVGWARSGPQGLIGSHKGASAQVVELMMADSADLDSRILPERDALTTILLNRGVSIISFDDWKQLDEVEQARGERRGTPRDKIVDVASMLAVLGQR
jgi:ferredoxin--NADP+ reductase